MDRPAARARRRPDGERGASSRPSLPRRWRPCEKRLPGGAFETGRFAEAIDLFSDMSLGPDFEEFLTLPAYEVLEA